jgi:hypothetical protein
MAIIDQIAEERRLYMSSAQTRRDWVHYVANVERLRRLDKEVPRPRDQQTDH